MKKVIFIALVVLLLDQLSKFVVRKYFNYTTNTGAAFGILQNQNIFLTVVSVIALVVFFYFAKDYDILPIGLLIGGTLGNLTDRLLYGHVIDFINLGFWPSFNIADSSNTIGIILLVLSSFRNKK